MCEEVTYRYVASVLDEGIQQWNHAVARFNEFASSPEQMLAHLDSQEGLDIEDEKAVVESLNKLHTKAAGCLFHISLKRSSTSFMNLALTYWVKSSFGRFAELLFSISARQTRMYILRVYIFI